MSIVLSMPEREASTETLARAGMFEFSDNEDESPPLEHAKSKHPSLREDSRSSAKLARTVDHSAVRKDTPMHAQKAQDCWRDDDDAPLGGRPSTPTTKPSNTHNWRDDDDAPLGGRPSTTTNRPSGADDGRKNAKAPPAAGPRRTAGLDDEEDQGARAAAGVEVNGEPDSAAEVMYLG